MTSILIQNSWPAVITKPKWAHAFFDLKAFLESLPSAKHILDSVAIQTCTSLHLRALRKPGGQHTNNITAAEIRNRAKGEQRALWFILRSLSLCSVPSPRDMNELRWPMRLTWKQCRQEPQLVRVGELTEVGSLPSLEHRASACSERSTSFRYTEGRFWKAGVNLNVKLLLELGTVPTL